MNKDITICIKFLNVKMFSLIVDKERIWSSTLKTDFVLEMMTSWVCVYQSVCDRVYLT